MTREENIQKKAEEYGELASVFLEGAKFALKNQWISTKEDLPCNHEELLKSPKSYRTKSVIVRFDNNMHGFLYMTNIPNSNKWEWLDKIKGITHWMIIPELPKE